MPPEGNPFDRFIEAATNIISRQEIRGSLEKLRESNIDAWNQLQRVYKNLGPYDRVERIGEYEELFVDFLKNNKGVEPVLAHKLAVIMQETIQEYFQKNDAPSPDQGAEPVSASEIKVSVEKLLESLNIPWTDSEPK